MADGGVTTLGAIDHVPVPAPVPVPALLVFLAVAACAAEPAAAPKAPSTRPAPAAAAPDWARGPWTRLTLKRFGLSLDLPDPKGWQLVKNKSRFIELDHPASGSRLVVRSWFEHEPMTALRCEALARRYRDFPSGGDIVEARRALIAGFDVVRTVRLSPTRGSVVAFGANADRCLALAFSAEGSARRDVEQRIIAVAERTLAGLGAGSGIDIDPREPRHVLTPPPP